ncbi:hypothetical protein K402DRAFT_420119 [Aulographum hederae CBS 113979]|uniref:Probable methionine--tRNA ligase, mitochondrial n=1 Tax=Aulographum hederae CBS 113979 TaxID=1176131 RepID=A0A6G1H3N5_9PEZI|nr:hypothetical protein K402DRAFT_420119 [Aulographum hederae CBS 113979]
MTTPIFPHGSQIRPFILALNRKALRVPLWTCSSCRQRLPRTRNYATQHSSKPYYVTTPIFYVNADPHVGHLYTIVLTDILKRWQQLRGREAIICTGTDEHGLKVQQAARKAREPALVFCQKGAAVFKALAARAQVSTDHFIRTTDAKHRDAVEYAWFILQERGYIYTAKHEGWYCVSDETFYPEGSVHLIIEPQTGRKIMASIETGKEVQWTSEENYHFRLSEFKDKLLQFYEQNPEWIVPKSRMKNVVDAVSSGLEDLSISRPSSRLKWGIRVPGDESQTIYVWIDALVNYITEAGYPWSPEAASAGGWPADCQVIGKDIIRFHCIYWPAILMALGVPLPSRVLTHAHWTLGHKKMAKSDGNGVNPFFAIERFGVDAMRFYLAHDGGIEHDADYSNFYIIDRYKHSLQNALGGLTSRICRAKRWNVRNSVEWSQQLKDTEARDQQIHIDQRKQLEHLAQEVNDYINQFDVSGALQRIMKAIYATNKYVQDTEPWAHTVPGEDVPLPNPQVDLPIFLAVEALRIGGILLQPFMPDKARLLLDMIGVDEDKRSFDDAEFGAGGLYGTSKINLGKGQDGSLFPALTSEE